MFYLKLINWQFQFTFTASLYSPSFKNVIFYIVIIDNYNIRLDLELILLVEWKKLIFPFKKQLSTFLQIHEDEFLTVFSGMALVTVLTSVMLLRPY